MQELSANVKRAIDKREYTRSQIKRWQRTGQVSSEMAALLDETQSGHEDDTLKGRPELSPELQGIVGLWYFLGPPCTVYGGMAMGLQDERGRLFEPRMALLRESGVTDLEDLGIYFRLLGALDIEYLGIQSKRLSRDDD